VTTSAHAGIFARAMARLARDNWRALVFGALALAVPCACAGISRAEQPVAEHPPIYLAAPGAPESVYPPPAPKREEEGINEGAVHLDLAVRYMTDYVYRGLDRSDGMGLTAGGDGAGGGAKTDISQAFGHEDAPNLQIDSKLSFDLGKLPHPYLGAFVNVFNADPVSRFQEVRPFFGAEWTIRPFVLEGGYQSYIFPEREKLNTAEVYGRIALDDSLFFRTARPVLSPYIYAAYDIDVYNGWYFETGVRHDFVVEDTGITVTALADVAYVMGNQQFAAPGSNNDVGLQHYDVGLIGSLSVNQFFGFSRRYGEVSFEAYLMYTDGIANDLLSTTQAWGGVGIRLRY
jgi:hypothetical protein